MKLCFMLFVLLVANLSLCYCDKIALLGSHYVSEQPYKFYLITDGISSPSTIDVNLDTDDHQIEPKRFEDFSTNIIESDFAVEDSNSCALKIKAAKCEQSVNLIRTSDQPLIFIHINKPIYKTGEQIDFVVFVLDSKLIPMQNHKRMDITILDSKRNSIKIFEDAKGDEYGIFRESIHIADDPYLGNWMIQVIVGAKNITKSFEVQKYEEGDIEVFIDAPSIIAHEDRKLYMTIYAKNSDGNFVHGYASISLTASFIGKNTVAIDKPEFKKVDLKAIKTSLNFDISEDFQIRFPTEDMILNFKIKIIGDSSIRTKTAERGIKLIHKGRNTIQAIGKKYFKPTFRYPLKIRVKTFDGKQDNSFNQLTMGLQYINDRPSDVKTYSISLKNGETTQFLQPNMDTKKIIVNLEFAGTKLKKEIDVFPTFGVEEFMQVTVASKSTTIGDKIRLSVNATEEMEELHLVIFGTNGIIHSDKFTDSIGKDTFDASFTILDKMKPEARGIVFYVKNGVIIYDEFSVSLGFSIDNSLELEAKQDASPNTNIDLGIKTEQGSQVFLTAIDSISTLMKSQYEISRTDIYNQLVYYMNKKFPSTSGYHFEKINPLILEPLTNGQNCKLGISERTNFVDVDEEDVEDNVVHQYFPKVSYDINYNSSTSEFEYKSYQVPNSISTSKLFGISVHKTKGFTVAKVQPEIKVKNEVFIQIEAPSTLRSKETVSARILAYNFQSSSQNSIININIKNGFFLNEKSITNKGKVCLQFTKSSDKNLNFNNNLPANGEFKQEFLITSNDSNPIQINAKITIDSYTHETNKLINVEDNLVYKNKLSSLLIESNVNNKFNKVYEKTLSSEQQYIILHGNLLGPAVNGLESIFKRPMILSEEKVLNFAASIIIYKFTKLRRFENDEVSKKALNNMHKCYQEILPILQELLNSNAKNQDWFISFITGVLINAEEFMNIDKKLIDDSLHYVKTHLKTNGNFDYDKLADLHRDINNANFRGTVQTALIATTFLKKKEEYENEILKMIKYIKQNKGGNNDHYVNSIIAYTLALYGNITEAKNFIPKGNYSNLKKFKDSSSYSEMFSYIILTKILTGDDPKNDVELLISLHRNAEGGFYSPYDTVIGLHALYEYTKFKNIQTNTIQYEIGVEKGSLNQYESKTMKISGGDNIKITSNSLTYASLYSYEQKKQQSVAFLKVNNAFKKEDETKLHLTFKFDPPENIIIQSNQIVIEIEMPRGHRYDGIETNLNYHKINLQNNGTLAVFYINYMERNKEYKLKVKTSKLYDFYETESGKISFYDYYRTNLRSEAYFLQDFNAITCNEINT